MANSDDPNVDLLKDPSIRQDVLLEIPGGRLHMTESEGPLHCCNEQEPTRSLEPFGIDSPSLSLTHTKRQRKTRETALALALAAALMASLVIIAVLAILLTKSHSEVKKTSLIAASALLASPRNGIAGGSESRALLLAAEVATEIGQESLVISILANAISGLARSLFWQFDVRQHSDRVSSVEFAPLSVPGSNRSARLLTTGSWDSTVTISRVGLKLNQRRGSSLLPDPDMPTVTVECKDKGKVQALAWSPSGEWLAVACSSKDAGGNSTASLHLWTPGPPSSDAADLPTLKMVAEMKHEDAVRALAWGPDSSALAAGDDNGNLQIWLVHSAKVRAEQSGQDLLKIESVSLDHYGSNDVRCLGWSPDGSTLVSGRTDNRIFVWDVTDIRNGQPQITAKGEGHTGDFDAIAFSPDGRMFASGDDNGVILLWDARDIGSRFPKSGAQVPIVNGTGDLHALPNIKAAHVLSGHIDQVTALTWLSPTSLASSSRDETVRIYDITLSSLEAATETLNVTSALKTSLRQPATDFRALAFADMDPPMLIAGADSGTAFGWRQAEDLGAGGPQSFRMQGCSSEVLRKFSKDAMSVRGSSQSTDGSYLAISTYEGNVCIWEHILEPMAGSSLGWKLNAVLQITGADRDRNVPCRSIEFSPSGGMLAGATDNHGVHVWKRDMESGTWKQFHEHFHHNAKVSRVAWSPDEKFLASASEDKSLAVVRISGDTSASNETSSVLLERHSAPVHVVAWYGTLEGGNLILASGSDDSTIGLWNLKPSSRDGPLKVASVSVITHPGGDGIRHLAWAPGLDRLASVSGTGKIAVHDGAAARAAKGGDAAKNAPAVSTFDAGAGGLRAMDWNPDGTQIVAALPDDSVHIWSIGEGDNGGSSWRLQESCKMVHWLARTTRSPVERISCARGPPGDADPTGSEAYDYMLQFLLVKFHDQLASFRRLTFGELSRGDLSALGLLHVDQVTALVPS